ncbi:putative protein N(5)-glutamine methyltransferase [Actinomadura gamaensis]|uniref:Release factor glutamine methyltransferase n=1 Tax=Actinomadura gamaensis TaxID=1763541 RepID=A0ABV9TQE6_9ACTN
MERASRTPPAPGTAVADVAARLRKAGCVFAEDEAELILSAASTPDEADAMVARRADGEPLEHVVGFAEFHGLRIAVEKGVFVPRRRTEVLIREAAAVTRAGAVVVDLCCGSGALGAALAAEVRARPEQDGPEQDARDQNVTAQTAAAQHDGAQRDGPQRDGGQDANERGDGARRDGGERVELHAADIDPVAVRCARRNVPGEVHEGDLFEALPADLRGRVDVLLANVPYVPSREIGLLPSEARDHEARVALDGGEDGLNVLRRVTADAAAWLAPGGHLLCEISERQVPAALAAFAEGGLEPRIAVDEDWSATVILGRRPRAS